MEPLQTLQELDASECRRLLQAGNVRVGRMGFVDDEGRPLVLPLNFQLHEDAVVLRTGEGEVLGAVHAGRPVAFEVDHLDHAWREGWSVLVRGVPEEVTDEASLQRLSRLGLSTWAPGQRDRWVRRPTDEITGRRIL